MPIELATPISRLFDDAHTAARIASISDCLECRDHTVDSKLSRQHLFHSDASIIHPWTLSRKRSLARIFASKPDLRLVTFHAACNCELPSVERGMFQPGGRRLTRQEMLQAAMDNTAWLDGVLPETVQIAVENNNYFPTGAYETVTDGDFLTELAGRTGCGLLLDIAHAMITAHNTDREFEEYASTLPLARTMQIHVCEPELRRGSVATDAHHCPGRSIDKEVLSIARSTAVKYVTIEYYGDADLLIDCIQRYRSLLS